MVVRDAVCVYCTTQFTIEDDSCPSKRGTMALLNRFLKVLERHFGRKIGKTEKCVLNLLGISSTQFETSNYAADSEKQDFPLIVSCSE